MKNKKNLIIITILVVLSVIATSSVLTVLSSSHQKVQTESVAVRSIGSSIVANGSVHSVNETALHFQTGGKLISLPVKSGDSVYQGQTIAQLDTYPMQQQLAAALNTYRSTRDTFDQTQANTQTGVLQTQQQSAFDLQNHAAGSGQGETDIINGIVKRIVDQNQANLDNSVIQVQLATYALQLSTLTAPFSGVVTNEDVTSSGVNITPTTNFMVADPTNLIFKANIASQDVDFVKVGAVASLRFSGKTQSYSGTVTKLYPAKVILPTGEEVYQVDITISGLTGAAKLGQTGTALIASTLTQETQLVPTWTILGHKAIWVLRNGNPVLVSITLGKTHASMTEVTSGLISSDRIIVNPASITQGKYQLL